MLTIPTRNADIKLNHINLALDKRKNQDFLQKLNFKNLFLSSSHDLQHPFVNLAF